VEHAHDLRRPIPIHDNHGVSPKDKTDLLHDDNLEVSKQGLKASDTANTGHDKQNLAAIHNSW